MISVVVDIPRASHVARALHCSGTMRHDHHLSTDEDHMGPDLSEYPSHRGLWQALLAGWFVALAGLVGVFVGRD
jgi:hypothetical protein